MRLVIGLALGVALFVIGIPTLISFNRKFGIHPQFGYDQAVMGMLLVLACVVVIQLTGLRPPPPPPPERIE